MADRITASLKTDDLTVKYSHVSKPDTKYNAEGEYKVTVEYDEALEATLQEYATKWKVDQPFVKTGKDGSQFITFKSKYQPKMFTTEGVEARTPGFCWKGDTVNINSVIYPVEVMGKTYLSLKFNAVLLKEVATDSGSSSSNSNPFGTGNAVSSSEVDSSDGEQPDEPTTVVTDEVPFG
tara:strand:- start:230 stop:766 length:537 start_codon:yes stop_codon:yes gene_type:complete